MARVTWTPGALRDLDEICEFIARDSPAIARTFGERVFDAADRLADFPAMGRAVPGRRSDDLRELIVQRYRVIYRLLAEDVVILAVQHGARRLDFERFDADG